MSRIEVCEDRCTGCGVCVSQCPAGAIEMTDNDVIRITEACTFCGMCVRVCPVEAIEMEVEEKTVDLSAWRGVWVVAEQREGELSPVTLELLGAGRRLADELQVELAVVVPGDATEELGRHVAEYPLDKVYLLESPVLRDYSTLLYTQAIVDLARQERPEIILVGATAQGRDLAPRMAIRLESGLTADCTGLAVDQNTRNLVQTRPAFGGNVMATIICPYHRPQIATVRPKVMKKLEPGGRREVEVVRRRPELSPEGRLVQILSTVREDGGGVDLQEAEIIVSGGRGLGKPEHFELIRRLADALGGAVGASRSVVDAGWIPSYHQVGQTGKTVQPKLYVACGISGAIQHQVGMRTSDIIVAVNKDPEAPIFNIATFGVVEDLHQFIPRLIERLEQARS